MQDHAMDAPFESASEDWAPQTADPMGDETGEAGGGAAVLEGPPVEEPERDGSPDGDVFPRPGARVALEPAPPTAHAVEPAAADAVVGDAAVRAGELTRGRRRDLSDPSPFTDTLKIVYWGPGRSGKTTNLKWLHGRLRPEMRGRLITLDGPGERTLYFDCLPLDLTPSGANPIQLRLYTVPGQPRFRLTRKLVLDGVDGIVFVWDSRSRRLNANLASLIEMRETLAELGISWFDLPRVVQYNKLDLDDHIPPEQLDHVLDRMGERVPRLPAVATRGTGVLDTLGAISRAALRRHREAGETRLSAGGTF